MARPCSEICGCNPEAVERGSGGHAKRRTLQDSNDGGELSNRQHNPGRPAAEQLCWSVPGWLPLTD